MKLENEIYTIFIDNKRYDLNVIDMINYVNQPLKTLVTDCRSRRKNKINNIPKDDYLYAVKSLINDYNLNEYISESAKIFVNSLSKNRVYDLEAKNTYLDTKETLYQNICLDEYLVNTILKDIDKYDSKLEKAIVIYINMCMIFRYDEEYFINNQDNSIVTKHSDIHYLNELSLNNNSIVCYEFNIIYEYLLNKIGINFETIYKNDLNNSYGKGHAYLRFRCDKYIIEADSVRGIIDGDLTRIKLKGKLNGLKCLNSNEDTVKEFNDILDSLYKEEKEINIFQELNLDEKIKLFLEKSTQGNYNNIEFDAYLIKLYKELFEAYERLNDVKINIVCYQNDGKKRTLGILSVLNEEEIYYYVIRSGNKPVLMSYKKMKQLFDDNIFSYIKVNRYEIPGIENKRDVISRKRELIIE